MNAYQEGANVAANGGYRAMPASQYKILTREWREWYRGYDETFNPCASDRIIQDRAVSQMNHMQE